MNTEIIQVVDYLTQNHCGKPISDLQVRILEAAATHTPYINVAIALNCTEGHVRDTAYELWQILTQHFGRSVYKSNVISIIEDYLSRLSSKPQDSKKCDFPTMETENMKEYRTNVIQALCEEEFSDQQIQSVLKIFNL